jgi:hypothetical protein
MPKITPTQSSSSSTPPSSLPPSQPSQGGGWLSWLWGSSSSSSSQETYEDVDINAGLLTEAERAVPPTSTTQEVGGGILSRFGRAIGSGVSAIKRRTANYFLAGGCEPEIKHREMATARATMMESLDDPQFVALAETLCAFIGGTIGVKIDELEAGKVNNQIKSRKELLKDLISINFFRGLANLAGQVESAKASIPNYDKQPPLANVLVYLCRRGGTVLNADALQAIQLKYSESEQRLKDLGDRYPNFKTPEKQLFLKAYIVAESKDQFISAPDGSHPLDYLSEGFSAEDSELLRANLSNLFRKRDDEKALFSQAIDLVLTDLFPNKVNDLMLPGIGGIAQMPLVRNLIYSKLVVATVTDLLFDEYEPLSPNSSIVGQWQAELTERTGAENVDTIVQAPAALILGFVRNYIQTDPAAVEMVAEQLESLHPAGNLIVGNGEVSERGKLLGQISQVQQAQSIIQSLQSLLNTQDPTVIGLGKFFQNVLGQLTTGLLAKGSALVANEGETIPEDKFVTALLNKLNTFIQSAQGEETIPMASWINFLEGLPIPPALKALILPQLEEKIGQMRTLLQAGSVATAGTENKIRGYAHGEQLLAIINQVSDHIVEHAVEENLSLVSAAGLGDTIGELMDQFLPGVEISAANRAWLTANIKALSSETGSVEGVRVLKQGVQIVLRQALVNIIESNFENSGEYAAQLLDNIHRQFSSSLENLTPEDAQGITHALAIQNKIEDDQDLIVELKKQLVPSHGAELQPKQEAAIQGEIKALKRVHRAETNVHALNRKRTQLLAKLNQLSPVLNWNIEKLPTLNEAFLILKSGDQTLHPRALEEFSASIQEKITDSTNPQERLKYSMVAQLIEMDADALKVLSELLNTHVVLENAERDLMTKREQFELAEAGLQALEGKYVLTVGEWEKAKTWLNRTCEIHQEIHELSLENSDRQVEVDAYLGKFRILSNGLMNFLGLEKKANLNLPPKLVDLIWPLIESAKNEDIARILFAQIGPALLPIHEREANRARLGGETSFLSRLAATAAEEVVAKIPQFVTSLKPFAEGVLKVAGIEAPTPAQVDQMEEALSQTLRSLGKPGITADLLMSPLGEFVDEKTLGKPEAARRLTILSERSAQLIAASGPLEAISQESIAQILREFEGIPQDSTDIRKLRQINKKAKEIAKTLNQFLSYRGKEKLTEGHLVNAYSLYLAITRAPELELEQITPLATALEKVALVNKIKDVVITPEEIARGLNDIFPIATDFQALVAPELQEMIESQDLRFKPSRDFIQKYIEGMLLRRFVKAADVNTVEGTPKLIVMTRKLQELLAIPGANAGKTDEEIAHLIIDQTLGEMIGLRTKEDIHGVPGAFVKIGFAKIKEKSYLNLTPLLLPLIQRQRSREELDRKSGSNYMSSMCTALSKDLVSLAPNLLQSYRLAAGKVFELLNPGVEITEEQLHAFAAELDRLKEFKEEEKLTNRTMVEAFARIVNPALTAEEKTTLIERLKGSTLKGEIQAIVFTPEEIGKIIQETVQHFGPEVQQAFADEVQDFLKNNPVAYAQAGEFISAYLEGVLLKIMIKVADKNPPVEGKDSFLVIIEKLLDLTTRKYQEARTAPAFDVIAAGFEVEVMTNILGLASAKDFDGLPEALQTKAYAAINGQLSGLMNRMYASLQVLKKGSEQKAQEAQAAENIAEFSRTGNQQHVQNLSIKTLVGLVANDAAKMVVDCVPSVLTQTVGTEMSGLSMISRGLESYLEGLDRGGIRVAQLLMNYPNTNSLKGILRGKLVEFADPENLVEDRTMSAELIAQGMLYVAADRVEQGLALITPEFEKSLMSGLLGSAAEHFKAVNRAKELARGRGSENYTHADLVQAARELRSLHAGMVVQPIAYDRSVNMIITALGAGPAPVPQALLEAKRAQIREGIAELMKAEKKEFANITHEKIVAMIARVTELGIGYVRPKLTVHDEAGFSIKERILEEASSSDRQRQGAFMPGTTAVLKFLFPKGKNDEKFKTLQNIFPGLSWKMAKEVFPIAAASITEKLFSPDVLDKIVLSSLEATRDTLNEKIVLAPAEPELNDSLVQASGELIGEILKNVELPGFIKGQLLDPATGEVPEWLKHSMGGTLRGMLNGAFIAEKLKTALITTVKRDPVTGDSPLKFDERPKEVQEREAVVNRARMERDLKRVSRELVKSGISFYIRKTWVEAQAKFDEAVNFGPISKGTKKVLDAIFRFVFLTIVGNILALVLWPVKKLIQEIIYKTISLDNNRDTLLDIFKKLPEGQPYEGFGGFHENLIFRMGEAVARSVNEAVVEKAAADAAAAAAAEQAAEEPIVPGAEPEEVNAE